MPAEIVKKILLSPLSFIYKCISFVNLSLRGLKPEKFDKTLIISVDNISFGGTGKTPMVMKLSSILSDLGISHGIILRGYKGSVSSSRPVVIDDSHSVEEIGDEAVLYRRNTEATEIIIGHNRLMAVKEAAGRGLKAVILDDGFQSRNLSKDLKVMLLNPAHPWYYLRNFRFMAHMSDIVLSFRDSIKAGKRDNQYTYHFDTGQFIDPSGNTIDIKEEAITAFSALGDNKRFKNSLNRWNLKSFTPFNDHHKFTSADIRELENRRVRDKSKWLICTEKDFVKLGNTDIEGIPVVYLQNIIKSSYNLEETVSEYAKRKGIF